MTANAIAVAKRSVPVRFDVLTVRASVFIILVSVTAIVTTPTERHFEGRTEEIWRYKNMYEYHLYKLLKVNDG